MSDSESVQLDAEYSHTTVDFASPAAINVWRHERDKRDYDDGREDVGPIEGPVIDAILSHFIFENELLTLTHHFDTYVSEITVPVTVTAKSDE